LPRSLPDIFHRTLEISQNSTFWLELGALASFICPLAFGARRRVAFHDAITSGSLANSWADAPKPKKESNMAGYQYSPPADRPDSHRMLPSKPNLLRLVVNHEAFSLTQSVFHVLQTDFDFQHVVAIGETEVLH
jgi:hypothetical protein